MHLANALDCVGKRQQKYVTTYRQSALVMTTRITGSVQRSPTRNSTKMEATGPSTWPPVKHNDDANMMELRFPVGMLSDSNASIGAKICRSLLVTQQ